MNGERGSAVLEVALLGVPLLVPVLWVAVAFSTVQQARAGVAGAAREAGREWVAGRDPVPVARQALADRGVRAEDVRIRYTAAGSGCGVATAERWDRVPGAAVTVCVTATVRVPLLPGPRHLTAAFQARADPYRAVP